MVATVYGVCSLLKAVEVKHVGANKTATCKPFVVFDRKYKDRDGEWQEEKCAIALELWGSAAEQFADNVAVGSQVFVEGSLIQNSWEDTDGNNRTVYLVRVSTFKPVTRIKNDSDGRTDNRSNGKTNTNGKNNKSNQRRPSSSNATQTQTKRPTNQKVVDQDNDQQGYDDDSIPF